MPQITVNLIHDLRVKHNLPKEKIPAYYGMRTGFLRAWFFVAVKVLFITALISGYNFAGKIEENIGLLDRLMRNDFGAETQVLVTSNKKLVKPVLQLRGPELPSGVVASANDEPENNIVASNYVSDDVREGTVASDNTVVINNTSINNIENYIDEVIRYNLTNAIAARFILPGTGDRSDGCVQIDLNNIVTTRGTRCGGGGGGGGSSGGGTLAIGGTITSATEDSILFVGPLGVLAQDNANFSYDDATDTLAVGGDFNLTGDATVTGLAGSGVRCVQTDNNGLLSVAGAACGAGGGQTPWTSAIDADGYALQDALNLEFRTAAGSAPAGTVIAVFSDSSGDLTANVLTGKTFNVAVNGTDEYNFSSTALAMNSNNITGVGTAITATAGLTVTATAADLNLATATSGNITLAPASTGSVQVTSGVTTGTGTSSGLSVAANSLTTGVGVNLASSSLSSGSLLNLAVTGTAGLDNQKGINVSLSGANGTGAQTTYGGYFSNTHTGTSNNVGLYATATGGSNNYAAIFENGNVGIGTNTPTAGKLNIVQSADSLSGGITIQNIALSNSLRLWIDASDISHIDSGSGDSPLVLNGGIGNVGIGVSTPQGALNVMTTLDGVATGATNQTLLLQNRVGNDGEGASIAFSNSPTSSNVGARIAFVRTNSESQGDLAFYTKPDSTVGDTTTEKMRILANGNVGIGTTAPDSLLQVQTAQSGFQKLINLRSSNSDTGDMVGIGFNSEMNGDWSKVGLFYERTDAYGIGKLHVLSNAVQNGTEASLADAKFTVDSTGFVGIGVTSPDGILELGGNRSKTAWGVNGIALQGTAATYTDTSSSGTVASAVANSFGIPIFAASSATTYTTASNLYIAGAPAAGTNVTLTNAYALNVAAGNVLFGGTVSSPGGQSNSEVYGAGASALGSSAVVFGAGASATNDSTAIGRLATATGGGGGVAIGRQSTADGEASIAIGNFSNVTSTHAGSIALGYGVTSTAASQLLVGGNYPITNGYFGNGVTNSAPASFALHATGGSGTNIAGASLTLAGGIATGNAATGDILFQGAPIGSSGATAQTLATYVTIKGGGATAGNVGIGTTTPLGLINTPEDGGKILLGRDNVDNPNADVEIGNADNSNTDTIVTIIDGDETDSINFKVINAEYNTIYSNEWGLGGRQSVSDGTNADFYLFSNTGNLILNTTASGISGNVGVGTRAPDKQLEINSATGQNLRLTYNDIDGSATNYADLLMSSGGDLTIAPSGSDVAITGNLGITSSNTTQTTTASALALNVNSLTTGTGLNIASSSLSSGALINLAVTGTAGLTNQKGINVSLSGANGTGAQTTYGGYFSNTHTGTSNNVGLYATATGGTNNYAAIFESGRVGIGTTAPEDLLHVQGGFKIERSDNSNVKFQYNDTSDTLEINSNNSSGPIFYMDGDIIDDLFNVNPITQTFGIGQAGSYRFDVINATTGQTASNRVANFSNAGATFNTTASGLSSYGGYFSSTSTRSAGANDLTNVGLYATASGAQNNYAAIFEAGNVGIGTTAPTASLQIGQSGAGTSAAINTYVVSGGDVLNVYDTLNGDSVAAKIWIASDSGILELANGSTADGIHLSGYSGTPSYFKVGDLGIRTTAPDKALEINSAAGNNLRLTYNDADGSAANYADLLVSSSGDLTITPSGADASVTGNLATASADLGDGTAGYVITLGRNTNATNTGAGSINFQSKGGTAGYVWQDNAGNMRIHTAAPSNANDTAGTVIGTQSSVRSTKQDIQNYTDYAGALQMVADAPLHTFRYKKDVQGYGNNSPLAKDRIGYIADEVPGAFMWGNTIDQVSVNGILMASVKALNIKINNIANAPTPSGNQDEPLAMGQPLYGNVTVVLQSHLYLSGDSVGEAKILAGAKSVRVSFTKPYEYQPIVTTTPQRRVGSEYWVSDKDATGFTIYIDDESADDITFDWHSFAGQSAKLTVSNGTTQNIILGVSSNQQDSEPDVPGQVAGDSTADEEIIPENQPSENLPPADVPPVEPDVLIENDLPTDETTTPSGSSDSL